MPIGYPNLLETRGRAAHSGACVASHAWAGITHAYGRNIDVRKYSNAGVLLWARAICQSGAIDSQFKGAIENPVTNDIAICSRNTVYAIDADGELVFKTATGIPVDSFLYYDGRYIVSDGNDLYQIDDGTGVMTAYVTLSPASGTTAEVYDINASYINADTGLYNHSGTHLCDSMPGEFDGSGDFIVAAHEKWYLRRFRNAFPRRVDISDMISEGGPDQGTYSEYQWRTPAWRVLEWEEDFYIFHVTGDTFNFIHTGQLDRSSYCRNYYDHFVASPEPDPYQIFQHDFGPPYVYDGFNMDNLEDQPWYTESPSITRVAFDTTGETYGVELSKAAQGYGYLYVFVEPNSYTFPPDGLTRHIRIYNSSTLVAGASIDIDTDLYVMDQYTRNGSPLALVAGSGGVYVVASNDPVRIDPDNEHLLLWKRI